MVAEPEVFAPVFVVVEPGVISVAEPQAAADIAAAFAVLVPVSVVVVAVKKCKFSVWSHYLVMYQDSDRYAANGGGLIQGFCFRPRYAEPMHPRSQGTRVETQDRCGPVLPVDAPSGF